MYENFSKDNLQPIRSLRNSGDRKRDHKIPNKLIEFHCPRSSQPNLITCKDLKLTRQEKCWWHMIFEFYQDILHNCTKVL